MKTADMQMMEIDERLRGVAAGQPYPLVFATISGAHLYGFASPDSDYDLRGVHILPLRDVIGLDISHETIERSGIHDGLELDLVTHDIRKFFQLLLKKNGYVLEQLYSPLIVRTSPEHDELKSICLGTGSGTSPRPSPSQEREKRSLLVGDSGATGVITRH